MIIFDKYIQSIYLLIYCVFRLFINRFSHQSLHTCVDWLPFLIYEAWNPVYTHKYRVQISIESAGKRTKEGI